MAYAIALKQKSKTGRTVYLLKNGQLMDVKPEHNLIKTWKTYNGAYKKWQDLISQVSAYATASEIVTLERKQLYIDNIEVTVLSKPEDRKDNKVWIGYNDGYQTLVDPKKLTDIPKSKK